MPNDWHLVHLGSRAVGGAGMVCVEASGVTPEGRITPWDAGIWSEAHARAWKPVARLHPRRRARCPRSSSPTRGARPSCDKPWNGGKALDAGHGAWQTLGPSAIAFGHYPAPRAMTREEIRATVEDFARAARHALDAGFEAVEIHGAHGYLLHSFVSPLSNHRDDDYGGSLDNRMRFPLEVARAVRAAWPDATCRVLYRVSATDWAEGGWDLAQSIELAKRLKAHRHRPDRLLERRQRARREDPARPRLPGAVRRRDPARGASSDRRRGSHLRCRAGRTDRGAGRGRRGVPRARAAARPVLAAPRRASALRVDSRGPTSTSAATSARSAAEAHDGG